MAWFCRQTAPMAAPRSLAALSLPILLVLLLCSASLAAEQPPVAEHYLAVTKHGAAADRQQARRSAPQRGREQLLRNFGGSALPLNSSQGGSRPASRTPAAARASTGRNTAAMPTFWGRTWGQAFSIHRASNRHRQNPEEGIEHASCTGGKGSSSSNRGLGGSGGLMQDASRGGGGYMRSLGRRRALSGRLASRSPPVIVYPPDASILLAAQDVWAAGRDSSEFTLFWDRAYPCTQWTGVECDANGRVVALYLSIVDTTAAVSGTIPSTFGNLGALRSLMLDQQNMSGTIPSSLGSLIHLTFLDLSYNRLSGSLPESMGNLTALTVLNLGFNRLSGSLPSSLCSLFLLQSLGLHSNRLSGSLPSCIGSLYGLKDLFLSSNQLSGSLPSGIGGLTGLQNFFLNSNQLSGSLPAGMGDLTRLKSLILSRNKLEGPFPSGIGAASGLTHLDLSNNRLSGPLSANVGSLLALQHLNLSRNDFEGTLPASIGNLTTLDSLDLSFNQLSGSLPSTLSNLGYMDAFNLSSNYLTGSLPSGISKLLSNSSVLSNNFLWGNCSSEELLPYQKNLPNIFGENCFSPACGGSNRTDSVRFCSDACNSDEVSGPCGGHGNCVFNRLPGGSMDIRGACQCDPGFQAYGATEGTCEPIPAPPPPSPAPARAVPRCAPFLGFLRFFSLCSTFMFMVLSM